MADDNVWRMENRVQFKDTDGTEALRDQCFQRWGTREIAESGGHIAKSMTGPDLAGLSKCVADGESGLPFMLHQKDVRESMLQYAVQSLLTDQARQGAKDVKMDFLNVKSTVPDATKVAGDFLAMKNVPFNVEGDVITAHIRK
jgi:hypothetical protein